jgi:hypothetical protein
MATNNTVNRIELIGYMGAMPKLYHRVTKHLVAHLRYLAALMNCLLRIADGKRSLADFVI